MRNFSFLTLLAAVSLLVSCSGKDNPDNGKTADPQLTGATISSAGTALQVDLDNISALDLVWTAGSWDGEGILTYSVSIDKENGDFSSPVKVLIPAVGVQSVSVSLADLNTIFEACAADEEALSATAQWAVLTSAGGKTVTSDAQRIVMTRQPKAGPEPVALEVGTSVFAAGAGALEAGQQMNGLFEHPFNTEAASYQEGQGGGVPNPEYEFYTRIEAGKDFYLTYGEAAGSVDGYIVFPDAVLNTAGSFEVVYETPGAGFKAEETSVYRVRLNATEGKIVLQQVGTVAVRTFGRVLNANGKWNVSTTYDIPMEYVGEGTWKASDAEIVWGNSNWENRFDTYKFAVTLNGSNTQLYGAMYPEFIEGGANPTEGTDAKYWACQPSQGGGVLAKGSWRYLDYLLDEAKNPACTADIRLFLNFSQGDYYFHDFTGVKNVD